MYFDREMGPVMLIDSANWRCNGDSSVDVVDVLSVAAVAAAVDWCRTFTFANRRRLAVAVAVAVKYNDLLLPRVADKHTDPIDLDTLIAMYI